jgi:hypothetical protein
MKQLRLSILALGVGVLALSACEQRAVTSPDTPDDPGSLPVPNPVTGLAVSPGDGSAAVEEFEICKYGGDATFDYLVTDRGSGGVIDDVTDFAVAADECYVIAVAGGQGADVDVTEHVPAGYQLDSYDVTVITTAGSTTTTTTGPWVGAQDVMVSDYIAGTAGGGLRGVLVEFTNAVCSASLGDFVWDDADGDGIQDATEVGIPGVTVELYDGAAALLGTTVTDAAGAYLFTDLCSGDYSVAVDLTTLPTGYTASPTLQGGDPALDSNPNPFAITLVNATSDLTIDFGYMPPPEGGEGCTPGYWKNHAGLLKNNGKYQNDSWTGTGYATTDMYDTVFGVSSSFGGTLIEAAQRGGGGENALGRHAVAALLNAASSVDYLYTTADVIAMVQAAYASGDFEGAKDDLAYENEMGCPLN